MDKQLVLTRSVVPCLYDANLSSLPAEYLLSGIGNSDDLRIDKLVTAADNPSHWFPSLVRGNYFIGPDRFFLPSQSAAYLVPRTAVGNVVNLPVYPQESSPISAVAFCRDPQGNITGSQIYQSRWRFTGTIEVTDVSAVEQVDPDYEINHNLPYADTTKSEFVVVRRRYCRRTFQIPRDAQTLGSFSLDPPAELDLPITFSNRSAFRTQVEEAPVNPGEWQPLSDRILLASDPQSSTLGSCTYFTQYPATLIFSQDIVKDYQETLGQSTGLAWQNFQTQHFPVLDNDTTIIRVRDPQDQFLVWTIVDSLSGYGPAEKVCTLDLDTGTLQFGDGTTGSIPESGFTVEITYKALPVIWYETQPQDQCLATNLELNPFRNFNEQGFLYLSHRSPVVRELVLSCDKPTLASYGAYGPVYCGNDFTQLTCLALNASHDPLEDLKVDFYIEGGYGFFNLMGTGQACETWTGSAGAAQVVYYAPRNILDLGEIVELYSPSGVALPVYHQTSIPNDSLVVSPLATPPDLLVSNTLTFMVLDNDPSLPYNPVARNGGVIVLLYHYDPAVLNFVPIMPLANVENFLSYGVSLPTPTIYPQLRKFIIAVPRLVSLYCQAVDPHSGAIVQSNHINILIQAPVYQMGAYTVKRVQQITSGASIGTATYLTIDCRGNLRSSFNIGTITTGWFETEPFWPHTPE